MALQQLLLNGNALSSLPDLPASLRIVQLAGNQFETVPPQLHSCKFQILNLARNLLTEIPGKIFHADLKEINLDLNQLTSLPKEVSPATSLTILHASGNALTSLPTLPSSLQELNVSYNNISLPEDTDIFDNVTNLIDVDISSNKFAAVPRWLLRQQSTFWNSD